MKNYSNKIALLFVLSLFGTDLLAQTTAGMSGSDWLMYALMAIVAAVAILLAVQIGDSFLAVEAKSTGADKKGTFSIFPSWSDIFRTKAPAYTDGKTLNRLSKGYDIALDGAPESETISAVHVTKVAVQPKNFIGMSPIPKVLVTEGDRVKAGDLLFFDKKRPEIMYPAPVSGVISSVKRGEKRSIAEVIIDADKTVDFKQLKAFDLAESSRQDLVDYLLETGAWTMIRQRPFDIPAEPTAVPRDIFISTFDTAPLAPNTNLVVAGNEAAFQMGLDVLGKLTTGQVYLGLSANNETAPAAAFTNATGVEQAYFKGAHPAGNVGVQIHHIKPIGTHDKVWTLGVQEVITLGKVFTEQRFDAARVVAVVGDQLATPKYVRTYLGASVSDLVADNLLNDHIRLISGDVLSGKTRTADQYLNYYDDQLTVIEEGDYYEMFGWLLPIEPRPSLSRTFPNFLLPDQTFHATTNTHGEKRAFVMTSDYERVMPMDVLVQPLMKAIIVNDFERMEGLGLHELIEEDVALCEFACTSKQPLQQILREGLMAMHEEG